MLYKRFISIKIIILFNKKLTFLFRDSNEYTLKINLSYFEGTVFVKIQRILILKG